MGGGLIQLVAYGAQDVYLTGDPQITFFNSVFYRHTNFAMESIQQSFDGEPTFGRRAKCTLARNGDLVTNLWLRVEYPELNQEGVSWSDYTTHNLIKNVEISIGGQQIDRHTGEWLVLWNELTNVPDKRDLVHMMSTPHMNTHCNNPNVAYLPLQFWFCRNYGVALPLVALQYHEVTIEFEFNGCDHLLQSEDNVSCLETHMHPNISLWADYVYLDTEERRKFAKKSHNYLIDQVQESTSSTITSNSNMISLDFNHPVKELVWVCQRELAVSQRDHLNFLGANGRSMLRTAKLQFNGNDRITERDDMYFSQVQVYKHHTGKGRSGIYVYSFALKPEDNQPSGTANFSRLDNVNLHLDLHDITSLNPARVTVYAVNYNVLRITNGMGGLAYSN